MATAAQASATANDGFRQAGRTADAAKATGEQAAAAGATAFQDGMEKSLAGFSALNVQSKDNLDAMMASAAAAAKGAQSLGAQAMAYGKSAMDKHVETAKAMSSARSLQEVMELQGAYAKSAMEIYMAELNRASETVSTVMKGAFTPLNARAAAMAETLQAAR